MLIEGGAWQGNDTAIEKFPASNFVRESKNPTRPLKPRSGVCKRQGRYSPSPACGPVQANLDRNKVAMMEFLIAASLERNARGFQQT
jgi:hypothetical protein